jgi:hypothetical protein
MGLSMALAVVLSFLERGFGLRVCGLLFEQKAPK